jgi:uncharacterized protein (DUF885 family)
MPTRFALLVLVALLFAPAASVGRDRVKDPPQDPSQNYRRIADRYLDGYFAWRPLAATAAGLHDFDGRSTDFSRASLDGELARLRHAAAEIEAVDDARLPPAAALERRALLASVRSEIFTFDAAHAATRNPMVYASAVDPTPFAKRDFAPKEQRMKSVVRLLGAVPATTRAARDNLDPRVPRTFVTTAVDQAIGMADFYERDLAEAFAGTGDEGLRREFDASRAAAAGEMRAYAAWLKSDRLHAATDDFALGRDAYARMLREQELITLTPDQVLAVATRELEKEQARFAAAAKIIDPARPAPEVFKSIQRDHPSAASLVPDTAKHLEQIRQFVIDRGLVSVPSDVRAKVEETPRFARATSFASMESPGPFETKATEAYYYVTPVELEWDAKRKEEWLTAFNYYSTDVTSIHEAYPGHYVQALHLKASPASRVAKAFGSYAFVEGWAHYCEQMLIDEGFPGAGADPVTAAKYRLEQSDEALLRLCRLVCSVRMHCQGMTVDEATQFFIENCHFERAPARAEAERGTYDPGYGFYTLGKLQILKLRDDVKRERGDRFSLRAFHDELLSHGQPPVRLLREAMLKDRSSWGDDL